VCREDFNEMKILQRTNIQLFSFSSLFDQFHSKKMSDSSRPISHWPSSISMTTKSAGCTINRTAIPLGGTRRKLIRPSTSTQQTFSQRMAKTKHDVEELFKLYYSNDTKFNTFQQQIVTGKLK
jgi:hypothetical protein